MPDFFPADSVIRRVNSEPAIMFGAGRALLLQLAHPHVAQGVADHSDFQHNPFKRLLGTLEATYAVVMGSDELAAGVGRRIGFIHEHVRGLGYAATDPANLLWVHATLFDTALGCYERLVEPLSATDRATYYEEMARVAEVFGCPRADQPSGLAEFADYFARMVATIEITETGRQLARDIVRPVLPLRLHVPLAPALAVHRLVAIGTTPAPLREQFGFSWSDAKQHRLDQVLRTAKATFSVAPRPLRVAPGWISGRYLLRLAAGHVTEFDDKFASHPAAA